MQTIKLVSKLGSELSQQAITVARRQNIGVKIAKCFIYESMTRCKLTNSTIDKDIILIPLSSENLVEERTSHLEKPVSTASLPSMILTSVAASPAA